MTTSTASAPAHLPVAAIEAARKSAGAKAAAARKAAGTGIGAGAKAAATRRARLEAQLAEAARLEAERAERIAQAPVLRARLSIERARKFDRAAAVAAQAAAQVARIAEMKQAADVVKALGLTQPGTRGRKVLMVTRDNAAGIIARGRKAGVVA